MCTCIYLPFYVLIHMYICKHAFVLLFTYICMNGCMPESKTHIWTIIRHPDTCSNKGIIMNVWHLDTHPNTYLTSCSWHWSIVQTTIKTLIRHLRYCTYACVWMYASCAKTQLELFKHLDRWWTSTPILTSVCVCMCLCLCIHAFMYLCMLI